MSQVHARVERACERAGRLPEEVRIVAVTKQVPPEAVSRAARAGVSDFGENYAQELESKRRAAPEATWHFLGRLQRNKVRRVLEAADVLHALEPGRAADRLTELAPEMPEPPGCLVEVDFAGGRVGVPPEGAAAFVEDLGGRGLAVHGLMTVAPPDQDPRRAFRRLRELRDELRSGRETVVELSMGMSTDLEVGVEEGATMVRVGTAIFGPRARR